MKKNVNKIAGFIKKENLNTDKRMYMGECIFEQGFERETIGTLPLATPTQAVGKDLKDYKISGESKQGELPEEYQEVEYIESSGTQFIDLGYKLSNLTDFELKLATTEENPSAIRRIFGGYNSNQASTTRWELALLNATSSKRIFINYYDTTTYSSYVPTVNEPFVIKKIGTNLIVPNQTLTLSSATFNNNTDAYLFASNRANTEKFVGRVYYMKIYESGVLRTSLIPCYSKSDNTIGMYDLVSKTFYTNSGTETFIKGNDVVPTLDSPMEINNVGDKTKNLFNISNAINSSLIDNSDGTYTMWKNDSGRFSNYVSIFIPANTTIYISADIIDYNGTHARPLQLNILFSDGTSATTYYNLERTYTKDIVSIRLYQDASNDLGTYTKFKNFQIEYGNDSTSYEPYGYKIPIIVKQPNYNIMPSAEAGTKTNNNVTVTCDGKGTYTYTGSGEAEIFFDLKEPFVIPTSVGQGGTGTMSLFNSAQNNYARIRFYADNTMIESWLFSSANRKGNTYTTQGNRICNRVSLSTDSGFSGTMTVHPYFTNTGQYPDIAYVPVETDIYLDEPLRKIGNGIGVVLPTEYQQVEYIESTGAQYIDLGLKATEKSKINITFSVEDIGTLWRLFGCRTSSMNKAFIAGKYGATTNLVYGQFDTVTPNVIQDKGITSNTKVNVQLSSNGLYVDGTQTRTFPNYASFITDDNIILFASNDAGYLRLSEAGIRIYETQFWENNKLIRNMIPCYRKSDSVIGMYDTVNNVFYTNAGTGTFDKGTDTYTDYIDFKNQKVVRNTRILTFKGSSGSQANWGTSTANCWNYIPSAFLNYIPICTHLQGVFPIPTASERAGKIMASSYGLAFATKEQFTTVTDWVAYLKEQYDNGTPVEIVEPLSTPTEENIELPVIPSFKGTCIYEVDTEVIPSDMYIKYKSK